MILLEKSLTQNITEWVSLVLRCHFRAMLQEQFFLCFRDAASDVKAVYSSWQLALQLELALVHGLTLRGSGLGTARLPFCFVELNGKLKH